MVKAIVGPKGSGKTKRLVQCINDAVKEETGALVCIEKGGKLKFDINYQVRLIDARDYTESGYAACTPAILTSPIFLSTTC